LKNVSVKLNLTSQCVTCTYLATDYLEMIIIFGECGRNAREAAKVFSERFPNRYHPDQKVIPRAMARTQETGQVVKFYQIERIVVVLR
jgi:hypothetical protein